MDLVCMNTEIRFEKNTYNAGETAKGTLLSKQIKVSKYENSSFHFVGKIRRV
jgi:hypothetical protein